MKAAGIAVRALIAACGVILFFWFFIPTMLTRSFHIGALTGIGLSLLMIIYGIFGRRVNALVCRFWKKVYGKIILIILGAAASVILALAILCMVCMGNGKQYPAKEGSTCVVLGCRLYNSGPSRMLAARLEAAREYLEENPDSVCIVCGGKGSNEPRAEADAMYEYLVARGIASERIYVENESLDTLENLQNAAAIIEENGLEKSCAIVSNDYHIYRAVTYARNMGYEEPGGVAAYTLWWMFPVSYVREMYGIMEMWAINRVY